MASRADERRAQRERVRVGTGAGKSHLAGELLGPGDVSRLAGVTSDTVRAWRARGVLPGDVWLEASGMWLYSRARVEAFLRERAAKRLRDERRTGRKPPPLRGGTVRA